MGGAGGKVGYDMGKEFLKRAIAVVGTAIVLVAIHVASGKSLDDFAYLMLMNALIACISMTVYDPTSKMLDEDGKKLCNWRYWIGVVGMLFGEFALGLSLNATNVFAGALTLGIGLGLCAGAVYVLVFMWHVSVLGAKEHDLYIRKRFSNRIERAVEKKDTERVKRLLALVCRYNCPNHDYRKGSDLASPFDSGKIRNLVELKKSKEAGDANKASIVEKEIEVLATNLVASGYNNEDVKTEEVKK